MGIIKAMHRGAMGEIGEKLTYHVGHDVEVRKAPKAGIQTYQHGSRATWTTRKAPGIHKVEEHTQAFSGKTMQEHYTTVHPAYAYGTIGGAGALAHHAYVANKGRAINKHPMAR